MSTSKPASPGSESAQPAQSISAARASPESPPHPNLQFSAAESVLRLLIGSALISAEELTVRLRAWEQQVLLEGKAVTGQPAPTEAERVRYALIGFLFLTRQTASKELNVLVNQYQRSNPVREMGKTLDHLTNNPLLRRVLKPIRSQLDALSRRLGDDVEHWVRIGRVEEKNSRALADKGTVELIDEVIGYLAHNPSITNLVQQQGVGLAGEVVDSVRQQTASADDVIEGVLWRILRRPPRELDHPGPAHPPGSDAGKTQVP